MISRVTGAKIGAQKKGKSPECAFATIVKSSRKETMMGYPKVSFLKGRKKLCTIRKRTRGMRHSIKLCERCRSVEETGTLRCAGKRHKRKKSVEALVRTIGSQPIRQGLSGASIFKVD